MKKVLMLSEISLIYSYGFQCEFKGEIKPIVGLDLEKEKVILEGGLYVDASEIEVSLRPLTDLLIKTEEGFEVEKVLRRLKTNRIFSTVVAVRKTSDDKFLEITTMNKQPDNKFGFVRMGLTSRGMSVSHCVALLLEGYDAFGYLTKEQTA